MKTTFRHLLWICVLLCSAANGQTNAATYTVKPGDSFAKIARNTGCTPADLAKTNGLQLTSVIHPGQKLKLPGKVAAPSAGTVEGSHIIQAGDTFTAISRRYGVPLDALLAANPGIKPETLKPGQKILLAASPEPESRQPVASAPPANTPAAVPPPASPAPASTPESSEATDVPVPAPDQAEGKIQTVMVDAEMTYGEFAAKHGTDIARLNDLNGLDLASSTVLAKGSELYVPGQP